MAQIDEVKNAVVNAGNFPSIVAFLNLLVAELLYIGKHIKEASERLTAAYNVYQSAETGRGGPVFYGVGRLDMLPDKFPISLGPLDAGRYPRP